MKLGSFLLSIILIISTVILSSQAKVWQREAPDSTGTDKGEYCSLAIDHNDNPHIAYYDYDFKDLRYAYYENGIWTIDIVDSIGDAGSDCSIAVDSQGRPHISYQQRYLGYHWSLKYATLSDTGWSRTMVATSYDTSIAEIGEYCSITINNSDYPCISYTQKYPHKIVLAFKDVNGWHFSDVNEVYQPYYTKIRLENGEIPIIGYHRLGTQNENILEVAFLNPADSSWNIITLPDTVERISYGHLVGFDTDNLGNVYYVYFNADSDLQLAVYDGQNWNIETILDYPHFAGRPSFSLKINDADQPCLATFQDEIYFYRKINGQWESTMVDDGVSPGWYCSLAFDSDDYPRIAAYARTLNYTRDALFYYRYWPGNPQIVLIEPSHNFGMVWTQSYSDWECPLENQGDAPLYINDLEFTSGWWDTAYHVINTPLPRIILPQASHLITIRFNPYGDTTYFDTLKIFSNDSLNLETEVAIQGIGTSSGGNGSFLLSLKNVYIDHPYQLLRENLPLGGATTSLYQNNQVIYGPFQTDPNGEILYDNIIPGNYELRIDKPITIAGTEPGSTILENFGFTTQIEIGPGTNTRTILLPESLIVEKYQHIYNLTHIEKVSWNDSYTFSYPSEYDIRTQLDMWRIDLPPELHYNLGRLILAEDMTYQMFDPGYSIGKEFMRDCGELLSMVLYSENWGTSIFEILIALARAIFLGDPSALLMQLLTEVIQEFLQDMLLNLITEGIQHIASEITSPGDIIIMNAWDVAKAGYSGWSLSFFNSVNWQNMAMEVYGKLKIPFFQNVYVEILTDDALESAKNYSQQFQYNGDFKDAYDRSLYFIAHERNDVEVAEDICVALRVSADLFGKCSAVIDVLNNYFSFPYTELLNTISIAMKIAAYVEVTTAMGISGYTLFSLPDNIDRTVDNIYFPEGKPSNETRKTPSLLAGARIKPEALAMLKNNLLQSTSEYDSVLTEIKNNINSGNREEAILKLEDLMIAENNLRNNMRATSAPIYSVANYAKDSLDNFQSMYDTLKYRFADAGETRYQNYIFVLFSATDTSNEMRNLISSKVDETSAQNHLLANHVISTLDTISGLPIPAILVASISEQSSYGLEEDKPETINIRLQNIGTLPAENVSLAIRINDALSLEEEDSVYIGVLAPGEYSDTYSWTVNQFSTDYTRGIWTAEIQSSNAKTYSTSGSFAIKQDQTPGTGGKLTNQNIYNYPNPFNPDNEITTLRYSLEKTAKVTLKIFDAGGNLVKTVLDNVEQTAAVEQAIIWDGKNGEGMIVANGVYFFTIETSQDERAVGKIAVLR